MSVPSTVDRMMPVTASRRVFLRPSTIASHVGCEVRKSLEGIGNPAGWSRKLKPVWRFLASALSW